MSRFSQLNAHCVMSRIRYYTTSTGPAENFAGGARIKRRPRTESPRARRRSGEAQWSADGSEVCVWSPLPLSSIGVQAYAPESTSNFNPFNASCSKLLLVEGFSAILV